ncbi:hypothetical protein KC19_VG147900 [Ceratodon purpureus]|uniref:Secreted protein n=1 Tax=Ceratodon purpureus TaxID=3225 RepID=A0A8T0HQM8_CERPU|nr:hypothetical protein KC19_VG147900 [Ceratodon purpureus]
MSSLVMLPNVALSLLTSSACARSPVADAALSPKRTRLEQRSCPILARIHMVACVY